ncbi:MAG: hypothetical protein QOE14_2252, partial [Humisphaera sp.]|nr:hypothetical protein [Humisphaera sp.]
MAIVWMMIVWAVMIGIASFAVDYGRVQLAKTELLVAADAASRAAIGALPGGVTAAQDAAIELAGKNRCDGIAVVLKRNEDVEFLNYDR